MNDTDNFVANRAPAVIDFVFQDIDTLDEQGAGVIYDLCL